MERTVVMLAGYDPDYLRIAEFHVRRELASGREPVVIDATSFSGGAVDSFHRPTLKLFGLPYPGQDLPARAAKLGVEVLPLADLLAPGWDATLDVETEELLAIAVQSALITYFRTDQPNRSRRMIKSTTRNLFGEGRGVYRGFKALLDSDSSITRAYVPNGRFPHQKMAHLAAAGRGLEVLHFEKGETADGTYLQDHAPQNRLKTQSAVEPLLSELSTAEIEAIADTWLSRRAPSSESRNEFSALWETDLPPDLTHLTSNGKRVAGFFTSSQDEFLFLGPEWQLHEWQDQFEAFDATMARLENQGYSCYLRVHPNLATKAHDCFLRERAGVRWLAARHPELTVVEHDNPANTYSLLDITDAVFVWDSTVGLEASARGIPVWTMATSRYGLTADVREILSSTQLTKGGIEPWTVDPHSAKRFIAYLVRRDAQMDPEYQSWLPWNPAKPPLGARLAAVLNAGGIPYPSEAIKSQIDVYRHRSIKSNFRHLRGR